MIWFLAIALGIYMAVGFLFAYSILRETTRHIDPRLKERKILYWITNGVLFIRWSAGWLPIVIYYRKAR